MVATRKFTTHDQLQGCQDDIGITRATKRFGLTKAAPDDAVVTLNLKLLPMALAAPNHQQRLQLRRPLFAPLGIQQGLDNSNACVLR